MWHSRRGYLAERGDSSPPSPYELNSFKHNSPTCATLHFVRSPTSESPPRKNAVSRDTALLILPDPCQWHHSGTNTRSSGALPLGPRIEQAYSRHDDHGRSAVEQVGVGLAQPPKLNAATASRCVTGATPVRPRSASSWMRWDVRVWHMSDLGTQQRDRPLTAASRDHMRETEALPLRKVTDLVPGPAFGDGFVASISGDYAIPRRSRTCRS